MRGPDQPVAMDQNASAKIDPRVVADPNQERTVIVAAIKAGAAARVGVAAAVAREVVVEVGIAAVAVIAAQVTSVITVAAARLTTGAESNSVRAEEGPEAEAVAKAVTEAAVITVAVAVAAGVGPVRETGNNEMEVARDSFRNRLSGARATATTTVGAKITRGVAGGMAKETVEVDRSYLEPTRSLLLRSDLA